jgi:hypothetical protein
MSELMDTDEVAAMLRVSRNTLCDWRYRGIGPRAFKVGESARSKLVYRRADVVAYLEERYRDGR